MPEAGNTTSRQAMNACATTLKRCSVGFFDVDFGFLWLAEVYKELVHPRHYRFEDKILQHHILAVGKNGFADG